MYPYTCRREKRKRIKGRERVENVGRKKRDIQKGERIATGKENQREKKVDSCVLAFVTRNMRRSLELLALTPLMCVPACVRSRYDFKTETETRWSENGTLYGELLFKCSGRRAEGAHLKNNERHTHQNSLHLMSPLAPATECQYT